MFSQWCLTLFNPMDCSLPGSSIYGIFPASGLLFPTPGDLPKPVIKPSLMFPAFAGRLFTTSDTWEGLLQPWKGNLLAQSCPILFNPVDCSLPGSSLHGTLQARILEWVAISFSRRSSPSRDWTWVSCIAGRLFTVWATREATTLLKLNYFLKTLLASLVAQLVKNMPALQEIQVWFLGWEDPLEKEMVTHSSILAWRIPWTERSRRLQSMGSHDSVAKLPRTLFPNTFPLQGSRLYHVNLIGEGYNAACKF